MKKFSWTQPQCLSCWQRRHPGRSPVKLRTPQQEVCCTCGKQTVSGVYIRIDPHHCLHPSLKKDEGDNQITFEHLVDGKWRA